MADYGQTAFLPVLSGPEGQLPLQSIYQKQKSSVRIHIAQDYFGLVTLSFGSQKRFSLRAAQKRR
jgi:hypothetical protein